MLYTKGKYVVGEIGGQKCAVCFNEVLDHSTMRRLFDTDSITSAGFFNVGPKLKNEYELTASPYGESVGLRVKCDEKHDVRLVNQALGLFY